MNIIEKENLNKAKIVSECYNNIDDIYDDLNAKIELIKYLECDNSVLSYSLSLYASDVQILLKALQLKNKDL